MPNRFSYHPGERAVQQRAGEVAVADINGTVIADSILGGARPFIDKQFMVVLASTDENGAAWSSVLYGQPGFARAETATSVAINVPQHQRDTTDPFWSNLDANAAIGMLFIELGSRRRYRINGHLERINDQGIAIAVREAYPNCPKYIQRRHLRRSDGEFSRSDVAAGDRLAGSVETLIRGADTMFVASYNPNTGADASHRGGHPGFVQIIDDRLLRIPDYSGNSLFNTLGNIELDPRTGLCIPDFEGQRLLQLTGRARLLWEQEDANNLTGGTHRFWEFEIERWILRQVPQHLEWEYLDASPFNPSTTEA